MSSPTANPTTRKRSKPTLAALPLLDVPGASLDMGAMGMPPLTPLAALHTSANLTPGALPLLVQMPDGQRKQVDLPPYATVNDLRESLNAPEDWVLNFNSETLDNAKQLSNYNITDAYDHAGGLLKMIDTSELQPDQRLDAIQKACSVVAGISRGERDLERIITAALSSSGEHGAATAAGKMKRDELGNGNNFLFPSSSSTPDPSEQPSLRNIANGRASREASNTPNLSLSSFALPFPTSQGDNNRAGSGGPIPTAPPTPSELIRRLGASRPDLYPPKAADRMIADLARLTNPGSSHSKRQQEYLVPSGAGMQVAASVAAMAQGPPATARPTEQEPNVKRALEVKTEKDEELPIKRGNTWFEDVMKSLVPSGEKPNFPSKEEPDKYRDDAVDDDDDDDGDPGASDQSDDDSGSSPMASGMESGHGQGHEDDGSEFRSYDRGDDESHDPSRASGESVRMPKKRGRKRKNPEMSEDQRKALRQAQNRESAKQSRLRRKTIAAEYEKRVTSLSSENETLKDTIMALSDRLQFLQGLLTVSVTQRPGPGLGQIPAPVPGLQMPMVHMAPGGAMPIMSQSTSQTTAAAVSGAATPSFMGRPPPPL
jgi:bZIP transcription factor